MLRAHAPGPTLEAGDMYGGNLMCQLSSTMRRITTIGSSVLGELNGCRPVSSTYISTPSPHLRPSNREIDDENVCILVCIQFA